MGLPSTMPDTPENQAIYPQQKAQRPVWVCLLPVLQPSSRWQLHALMDLAIAPYQGKETGESALLRSMLGH